MSNSALYEFIFDFFGNNVFTTSPSDNAPFLIQKTAAAGTPTFALVTPSAAGEISIAFDSTNEVQNVTLYQNDILQFALAKIVEVEWRVKMNQAAVDSATSFCFGIAAARNATVNSMSPAAMFRVLGTSNATTLYLDSRDGTHTSTLVPATRPNPSPPPDLITETLVNAYRNCRIQLGAGGRLGNVAFFVDGRRVSADTTFNMSAGSGSVQLLAQLQKTASANVDGVTIDRISIRGVR